MTARPVVIRCDGSSAIGMGHVSRCLALARELRDAHGSPVTFAMRDAGSVGVAAVRAQGFTVDLADASADRDPGAWLRDRVAHRAAKALVADVRDSQSRSALETIRATGVRVVTIDDGSERRLAADLAFYPPVPQVEELDWSGFTGRRYTGWEYVILASSWSGGSAGNETAIDILITMGGSDPAGMTEFALAALNMLPMPLALHVVIGPGFARVFELLDAIARATHCVHVSVAPPSLLPLMRASRIALVSFGVTAYELAACGVPAVHLCLTDDHARSSSAFDREGIARTAGVFGSVEARQVADAVMRLMGDAGRRTEMAARARQLVDGHGAKRVAAAIAETVLDSGVRHRE